MATTGKRVIFAAVPNYADSPTVLTAGSEVGTLPASNLQTPQIAGEVWRTATLLEAKTFVQGDCGQLRNFAVLGVVKPNWSQASKVRVRLSDNPLFNERLAPNAIVGSTNLTGATTANLDEDVTTPDGVYATATVATSATMLHVGFPTPAASLKGGDAYQIFQARVRRTGGGGANPTLAIKLYEGGVAVATLASGLAVASTTGEVVNAKFDAALLGAISGANVELRLEGTASATATVEFDAVEWYADLANTKYDSGLAGYWPTVEEFGALPWGLFSWGGLLPEAVVAQIRPDYSHVLTTEQVARYFRIDISDPSNAAGYLEAARLKAGPKYEPSRNMAYGWSLGVADPTLVSYSRGGQTWLEKRRGRRVVRFELQQIEEAEAFQQIFQYLQREAGVAGDLLVILMPDRPDLFHIVSLYCRQAELPPIQSVPNRRIDTSFVLEELI